MLIFGKFVQLLFLAFISTSAVTANFYDEHEQYDAENEYQQSYAEINLYVDQLRNTMLKFSPQFCFACSSTVGALNAPFSTVQFEYLPNPRRQGYIAAYRYIREHAVSLNNMISYSS